MKTSYRVFEKSVRQARVVSLLAFFACLSVVGVLGIHYLGLRYFESFYPMVYFVQIAVGAFCLIILVSQSRVKLFELVFISFLVASGLFVSLFKVGVDNSGFNGVGPLHVFSMLASFYMAKMICYCDAEKYLSYILFFLFFGSFAYYAFKAGNIFAEGFFLNSSYNVITAAVIFISVSAVVSGGNKLLQALVLLLSFVICFSLYARSSMALSIGVFIWWAIRHTSARFFVSIFLLVFLFAFLFKDYLEVLYEGTKFAEKGLESPRWDMWVAYINHIDFLEVFFGTNLSSVDVIKDFNSNPHNSFIRLHSIYGFVSFLFIAFLLFFSVWFLNAYFLGLVFLLFLRALTDIILFPSVLDFFVFLVLLCGKKRSELGFKH